MKYIRTKDRVFETNKLPTERFSIELVKIIDKQVGLPNPHIEEIKIIKQADTIEELCDEFVALGYGLKGKPAVVIGNNGFKTIKEMLSNYTIYGAIWTDKGLIYVAKMNDEGELELL